MPAKDIKIHSVVACCNNGGIGFKGRLPWRLPKEMKYFKRITTGEVEEFGGRRNVVIIGRKTWESIPKSFKPLKDRINIVISRTLDKDCEGPDLVVNSLDELIDLLHSKPWCDKINQVFNIGGNEIYKLIHNSQYCGKIYLTRVLADLQCDTFLENLDDNFTKLPTEGFPEVPQGIQMDKNDLQWKVEVYEKKTT
uniref:Dihydrofolate reductase n=1 Tax=Ciona intestinalis TaxID=7719 RepID=H2XNW6_CIOIN|nr:dihydrofolate reductase-like [Ciona intestinalis]|eukprot:XP_002131259.1 dihydrofolate reductase-like [Ciona intestinalis]